MKLTIPKLTDVVRNLSPDKVPKARRKKKYGRYQPEPEVNLAGVLTIKYLPFQQIARPPSMDADFTGWGEIYCVTNRLTGRKYIGQTKCMKNRNGKTQYMGYLYRFEQHIADAFSEDTTRNTGCPKFYEALRKFGRDFFYVELLERCPQEELNKQERAYIKALNTRYRGYNATAGGQFKRKRKRKARG